MIKKEPTQEELKDLFIYSFDGQLLNRYQRGKAKRLKVAGYINDKGYRIISIDGDSYRAHRLTWVWHNGDIPEGMEIDHKDRVRANNAIWNLRPLTHAHNCIHSLNTKNKNVGMQGVSWDRKMQSWVARITVDKKYLYLGKSVDYVKACSLRMTAQQLHYPELF